MYPLHVYLPVTCIQRIIKKKFNRYEEYKSVVNKMLLDDTGLNSQVCEMMGSRIVPGPMLWPKHKCYNRREFIDYQFEQLLRFQKGIIFIWAPEL